jgi:hypothetical protein
MFCFLYRAWLYMSNTESVLKERELLTLRVHLSSLAGFNWVFPRAPEFTNGFGWVFLRAPEFTHWFWLAFRSCTWVHPLVLVGSFFVIFLVFCVVIYFCVLLVSVLCLVCPVLPVSPDCPGLIAPSVFSNVYFQMYSDHMSLVSGTNRTLVVIWEKIISKFLLSWKLSDRYCIL